MANAHKLLGAAVSVLSLACAAAYADSTPSSLVRFKDLNLDRPHDVARLFSRISSAAEKVCGPRFFDGLYSKPADFEICYTDAIGRAVAEIDRPALTAYFEQRSSHSASPNITIAKQ